MNWKKKLCVLLCIVMAVCAIGCGTGENQTAEDACLELVDSPATTLDNVWYNPGGIFRCALFESLLNTNADMTAIKPALAKEHAVSEDGLTYQFDLREDVKWHDGESFDAEDVVFSLKTALRSGKLNGIFTSAFYYIEGANDYGAGLSEEIAGIAAEENRVTIHLTSPVGDFLEVIAQFAILPEHLLGDVKPEKLAEQDYWKKPVGCGCYQVTEAVEGEYFMLEANKDYYGEKPGISKIRLRVSVEDAIFEMEEGRLDFYVTNDPEEISKMKGIDNYSEHPLNILFPTYLIFNLSEDEGVREDLKNPQVRKALLLAIDREMITEAIFPGSSTTNTLVPKWADWYYEEENFAYNQEEAKRLLEEAGFDFTKPLRLRYSVKGQATEDMMNAIAVYWRAVGINVDLQKFDGSGSKHMFEIRDFDVCFKRLSAFNYASVYGEIHGEGVMQTALYNQPVYDELINELQVTMEETQRKELIHKMQVIDQKQLLRIPLFSLANVAYVNDARLELPEEYGNLWFRYDFCFEDWKLVTK